MPISSSGCQTIRTSGPATNAECFGENRLVPNVTVTASVVTFRYVQSGAPFKMPHEK